MIHSTRSLLLQAKKADLYNIHFLSHNLISNYSHWPSHLTTLSFHSILHRTLGEFFRAGFSSLGELFCSQGLLGICTLVFNYFPNPSWTRRQRPWLWGRYIFEFVSLALYSLSFKGNQTKDFIKSLVLIDWSISLKAKCLNHHSLLLNNTNEHLSQSSQSYRATDICSQVPLWHLPDRVHSTWLACLVCSINLGRQGINYRLFV